MTRSSLDSILVLACALSLFALVDRWSASGTSDDSQLGAFVLPNAAARGDSASAEGPATDDELSGNPFRLSNRLSRLRHGAVVERAEPSREQYRPALRLLAIVGGPPWSALISGVPGRTTATLVATDERVDSLRVRSITRDAVVVVGPDTTWTLTLDRNRP